MSDTNPNVWANWIRVSSPAHLRRANALYYSNGRHKAVLRDIRTDAGQYHLANRYRESNRPGDWAIATTQNGWTDNKTGPEWLKYFDRHTTNRSISSYRLLILDGHESHHFIEFERYCDGNKIIWLWSTIIVILTWITDYHTVAYFHDHSVIMIAKLHPPKPPSQNFVIPKSGRDLRPAWRH
ncbi:hypothetical protein CFIMG_007285RA00001 [Ceratocystis fimbriata CBS 114723]|uniref:DDE-1 domain-containing protein n=1 Tax=Ceratocystis fimbriata CBS 114723 TaxID=1035309 RepID=A0A2C5X7B1_9PEZI|nr:hypothetical protein CFIMG_007285RA00001 [Ceratocystis fimbriata CBS 114723]